MSQLLRSRPAAVALTAGIVGLTLATAYIHYSIGGTSSLMGLLFLANAAGYAALAVAIVVAAVAPTAFIDRFSWLPRLGLAGFTAATIGGYLVMGPYFTLGFITKGIETAIIVLLVVDVVRVYGSPAGMVRAALGSIAPLLPARFRTEGA